MQRKCGCDEDHKLSARVGAQVWREKKAPFNPLERIGGGGKKGKVSSTNAGGASFYWQERRGEQIKGWRRKEEGTFVGRRKRGMLTECRRPAGAAVAVASIRKRRLTALRGKGGKKKRRLDSLGRENAKASS